MTHQATDVNNEEIKINPNQLITPNGKVLEIVTTPHGLFGFQFTSGGQLPAVLTERFTHKQMAFDHAKLYIESKELEQEIVKTKEQELKVKEQELKEAKEAEAKKAKDLKVKPKKSK